MPLPAELMVLAGLTQARLVGPTVDEAGVPHDFWMMMRTSTAFQSVTMVDENRWRRPIV